SASSFEEPVLNSGLKDVAYAAVASVDHNDGIVKSSKHTTFVDIVGRSCNSGSGSDKYVDANSVTRRANAKFVFCIERTQRTRSLVSFEEAAIDMRRSPINSQASLFSNSTPIALSSSL
ncbi:hypothetical protein Tco_1238950, partial [Tanacetum coccineum]